MGGKSIFPVNHGRQRDATATKPPNKYPGLPVINVLLGGITGRMQAGDWEDS